MNGHRHRRFGFSLTSVLLMTGLLGCRANQPPERPRSNAPVAAARPAPVVKAEPAPYPVMTGLDVLEADGFAAVRGKRIGLLTHPAGANRYGESAIDVLRRAPGVKLVALFGPEHGIYGDEAAEVHIPDRVDPRTGLPIYSLYGKYRKPTPRMLKGLDAMVIDLQSIGTRSYTFISSMLYTMAACFENNVEVIVLDRPNPLGGLKVDGPPMDADLKSYVGAFRVPYVYGLTIGELARMAKDAPGVLRIPGTNVNVSPEVRARGRLVVIPMRGWRRDMIWPQTGLRWIPTSPYIQDFAAVAGYPMLGLATYLNGFYHGIGKQYAFRCLAHPNISSARLLRILQDLRLPGLSYRIIRAKDQNDRMTSAVYVEITDFKTWKPTELGLYLMQLSCHYEPRNPYAAATPDQAGLFLRHLGSTAFFDALKRQGAHTDVAAFIRQWDEQNRIYHQESRKYWLYP